MHKHPSRQANFTSLFNACTEVDNAAELFILSDLFRGLPVNPCQDALEILVLACKSSVVDCHSLASLADRFMPGNSLYESYQLPRANPGTLLQQSFDTMSGKLRPSPYTGIDEADAIIQFGLFFDLHRNFRFQLPNVLLWARYQDELLKNVSAQEIIKLLQTEAHTECLDLRSRALEGFALLISFLTRVQLKFAAHESFLHDLNLLYAPWMNILREQALKIGREIFDLSIEFLSETCTPKSYKSAFERIVTSVRESVEATAMGHALPAHVSEHVSCSGSYSRSFGCLDERGKSADAGMIGEISALREEILGLRDDINRQQMLIGKKLMDASIPYQAGHISMKSSENYAPSNRKGEISKEKWALNSLAQLSAEASNA